MRSGLARNQELSSLLHTPCIIGSIAAAHAVLLLLPLQVLLPQKARFVPMRSIGISSQNPRSCWQVRDVTKRAVATQCTAAGMISATIQQWSGRSCINQRKRVAPVGASSSVLAAASQLPDATSALQAAAGRGALPAGYTMTSCRNLDWEGNADGPKTACNNQDLV